MCPNNIGESNLNKRIYLATFLLTLTIFAVLPVKAISNGKTVIFQVSSVPEGTISNYVISGGNTTWQSGPDAYGQGTLIADPTVQLSITASANSGYVFLYWSVNTITLGAGVATINLNVTTAFDTTTLVAWFNSTSPPTTPTPPPNQGQVALTISQNNPAFGTTFPTPGNYTYQIGTTVTLVATPASGYAFSDWTISSGTVFTTQTVLLTLQTSMGARADFVAVTPPTSQTPTPSYQPIQTSNVPSSSWAVFAVVAVVVIFVFYAVYTATQPKTVKELWKERRD